MEDLNKATEEFCCDCQLGINIKNCKECLFNVFKAMDKYPPFGGDEDRCANYERDNVEKSE